MDRFFWIKITARSGWEPAVCYNWNTEQEIWYVLGSSEKLSPCLIGPELKFPEAPAGA